MGRAVEVKIVKKILPDLFYLIYEYKSSIVRKCNGKDD